MICSECGGGERLILKLFSYLPFGVGLLYEDFSVGLCFTLSWSHFQYISQFLCRMTCFGEGAGHLEHIITYN